MYLMDLSCSSIRIKSHVIKSSYIQIVKIAYSNFQGPGSPIDGASESSLTEHSSVSCHTWEIKECCIFQYMELYVDLEWGMSGRLPSEGSFLYVGLFKYLLQEYAKLAKP